MLNKPLNFLQLGVGKTRPCPHVFCPYNYFPPFVDQSPQSLLENLYLQDITYALIHCKKMKLSTVTNVTV
jgi:hypothetical protein